MPDDDLKDDLLRGADEIGTFIDQPPRAVYNLAARGELPVFKLGAVLHARKSTLRKHIEELEAAAVSRSRLAKEAAPPATIHRTRRAKR